MASPVVRRAGSLLVGFLGAGMFLMGINVAVNGLGAALPSGSDVHDAVVAAENPTVESPMGDPIVYGEVRVRQPGAGTGAVDQDYSAVGGVQELALMIDGESRTVSVPLPGEWKGPARAESQQVENLIGLPIIGDAASEIGERWAPPYALQLKALRRGDHVVAVFAGDRVAELWPGERAEIEAWQTAQENARWPIVILMIGMGLASFVLSYRLFAAPAPD